MSASRLTAAARIILAIGTVAAVAWLLRADSGLSSLLNRLTLWTLLPYAIFFAASAFAGTRDRARSLLLVCALSTLVALLLYGATLLLSMGFTNALVLVFVPLFQLIPAVIVLAVLFFTRGAAASKSGAA